MESGLFGPDYSEAQNEGVQRYTLFLLFLIYKEVSGHIDMCKK